MQAIRIPQNGLEFIQQGSSMLNGISLVKTWKYKIQNDEPPAVAQYQASYQPFGDLKLYFKHTKAFTNYRRSLDLTTAIAKTSYTTNGITYVREYFASQPNQAIVVHLSANKPKSISFDAVLTSPHQHAMLKTLNNHTISIAVKVKDGTIER